MANLKFNPLPNRPPTRMDVSLFELTYTKEDMKRAFLAGFACSDDTHNGVVTYPEDGSDLMQSLDDTFAGFIKGLKTA